MWQERLHAMGQIASSIVHDVNNALSPIVVSVVDDQKTGFALGAVGYLVKPVSDTDLLEAVARFVPAGAPRTAENPVVTHAVPPYTFPVTHKPFPTAPWITHARGLVFIAPPGVHTPQWDTLLWEVVGNPHGVWTKSEFSSYAKR